VTNKLPGDAVIVYPVIADPPSELGALHEILKSRVSVSKLLDSKILGGKIGSVTHGHLTFTSLFPIGSYCISVCSFVFLPL
jgi:hypothetical protein